MTDNRKTLPEDGLLFEGMISVRALIESVQNGTNDRKIKEILYADERYEKNKKEYAFLSHRAEESGFPLTRCPMEKLDKMAIGNSHGGVLAIAGARTLYPLSALNVSESGFYILMEGIEDPYNFGYALRSIYASGADGIILSGHPRTGADGIICRSSAGASERLAIYLAEPCETVWFFKNAGYKIVSADLPHSTPVYDADLKKPLLLVVGGEKRGITRAVLNESDAIVRLDYGRPFDAALSAASAASILAFEVFRQNK